MSKRYEPVAVPNCVVGFAIFADYDGNAPDTADLIILSSQELAEQVVKEVADNYSDAYVVDGYEFSKAWKIRNCVAKISDVICSLDEAKEYLEDKCS